VRVADHEHTPALGRTEAGMVEGKKLGVVGETWQSGGRSKLFESAFASPLMARTSNRRLENGGVGEGDPHSIVNAALEATHALVRACGAKNVKVVPSFRLFVYSRRGFAKGLRWASSLFFACLTTSNLLSQSTTDTLRARVAGFSIALDKRFDPNADRAATVQEIASFIEPGIARHVKAEQYWDEGEWRRANAAKLKTAGYASKEEITGLEFSSDKKTAIVRLTEVFEGIETQSGNRMIIKLGGKAIVSYEVLWKEIDGVWYRSLAKGSVEAQ